jgi:hypothetical protein
MSEVNVPNEVLVWQFGGKPGNLRSQSRYETNTGYNLFCRTNSRFLTYAKQTFGINVDYAGDGHDHKWHLHLPDGAERDLRSGEQVALGLGGKPSFLRYAHRTIGINLEYADNAAFQWGVFSSGVNIGQPIPAGAVVALLNEKVEPTADFLIHFGRTGADIGWTTSPSDFKLLSGHATELVALAKVVIAAL